MNKLFKLNADLKNEVNNIIEISQYIWERGWVEKNGGHISVNLTDKVTKVPITLESFRFVKINKFPKALANQVFFFAGKGEPIRNLTKPKKSGCIIIFNESADGYHILWGGEKENFQAPENEISIYLKIHAAMIESDSTHKAIVHPHPVDLICLSYYKQLADNEKLFNNTIWSMFPEVRAFIPKGIALIPYTLPGSDKLAELTINAFKKRDIALWMKHGVIAIGKNISEAFDLIETANKGCKLFLKCLASGYTPEGMTKAELNELEKTFSLIKD